MDTILCTDYRYFSSLEEVQNSTTTSWQAYYVFSFSVYQRWTLYYVLAIGILVNKIKHKINQGF